MAKVSVIVPVYNTERYLCDCINSVIEQSYSDWELLLIDDGSCDGSYELCRKYESEDSRIIALHQSNQGASAARNNALSFAKGAYVIFLDSDDYWLSNNVLKILVSVAEMNNLDIIRGEYVSVGESTPKQVYEENATDVCPKLLKYSSSDFFKYAIHHEFFGPLSLFRRAKINTEFDTSRLFLEDMLFYSQILRENLNCGYLPEFVFYAYRKRGSSISSKPQKQLLKDSFSMCYEFISLADSANGLEIAHDYYYYSYFMYTETMKTLASNPYYSKRNMLVSDLGVKQLRSFLVKNKYFMKKPKLALFFPPTLLLYIFRIRLSVSRCVHKIKLI